LDEGTQIGASYSEENKINGSPFSYKDVVVELTGKTENAIRKESQDATVHEKETELDEKGRPAGTFMPRRCCTDHPQKGKVLYISID